MNITEKISIPKNTTSLSLFFYIFSVAFYIIISYPALYGTLELDDFVHLQALSNIHSFTQFIDYSFFQFSSSGKRFLSMFTFALQSDNWPEPFYFKLVNLVLHLCNGLIIYWLTYQLFRLKANHQKSLIASSFTVALWLFAPIHIFSIFYTIQRMNLLAVFFTLLGCAVYVFYRKKIYPNEPSLNQYFFLSLIVVFFLSTAIASKENGILLCIYLILIETVFFARKAERYSWKFWKFSCLWLPLLAVFIYLLLSSKLYYPASDLYPFSSGERLLNQTVILVEYLIKIVFPSYGQYGLIYDDIEVYRNWMNWPVIFSSILIFGLLLGVFTMRKTQPVLFFGLFWFFGGHILESTAIKLELYFDHRNYLPSMGIYLILAYYLLLAWEKINSSIIKSIVMISIMLYCLLTLNVLFKTAIAFSSEKNLAVYQLKFHPESKRAHLQMLNYLFNAEQYQEAALFLEKLIKEYPRNITLHLYQIYASNLHPAFKQPDLNHYLTNIRYGKNDRAIDSTIYEIFYCLKKNECPNLSFNDFRSILDALLTNPAIQNQRKITELFTALKAKAYSNEGEWHNTLQTLVDYESSHRIMNIDFYFLILQAHYMLGNYNEARDIIHTIEKKLEENPIKKKAVEDYINLFLTHIQKNESKTDAASQGSLNMPE